MRKLIIGFCILFSVVTFFSCAFKPMAPVEWRYEKSAINLYLTADPMLNLYNDRAHALHLCVYQLKDPTAFNQLAETPEGISELLQCQRFSSGVASAGVLSRSGIQPGDFLTLTLDRAEGARYFGIVAGYQILDKERTVRLINIPVVVEIIISAQQIERVQKPDLLNIDLHLGPQQIRKAVIMKWQPKK